MNTAKRKLLSVILAVSLLAGLMMVPAAAAEESAGTLDITINYLDGSGNPIDSSTKIPADGEFTVKVDVAGNPTASAEKSLSSYALLFNYDSTKVSPTKALKGKVTGGRCDGSLEKQFTLNATTLWLGWICSNGYCYKDPEEETLSDIFASGGLCEITFKALTEVTAADIQAIKLVDSAAGESDTKETDIQNGEVPAKSFALNVSYVPDGSTPETLTPTIAAIADQTYTGSAIKPAVTVNSGKTDVTLKEGTDYSVAYANNVNVGTATVTVKDTGDSYDFADVSASFKINPKAITLEWTGYKNLTEGDTVNVTAAVPSGVSLAFTDNTNNTPGTYTAKASLNGDAAKNYTIINPEQSYTVAAKEAEVYTVTVNTEGNGNVTADPVSGAEGTPVTLTVTPGEGYELDKLTADTATITGNSFTMPASNVVVTATFKATPTKAYNINFGTFEHGSVDVDPVEGGYVAGGFYSFSAVPSEGYKLDSVTIVNDSDSTTVDVTLNADKTYSFTMPASDITITPVFSAIPTYSVNIDPAIANGKVTAEPTSAAADETVALTVTPADGYELDTLTVKQGETAVDVKDNQFTMPAGDVNVTATFVECGTVKLIVKDAENGKIAAQVDGVDVTEAATSSTVTIKLTPDSGYTPGTPAVSGKNTIYPKQIGSDYTFVVPPKSAGETEITITCSFDKQTSGRSGGGSSVPTVSITAGTPEGGKVTVSPASARAGTTVTVTPTPDEGFKVDKVTATGARGGDITVTEKDGKYTFTVPYNSGSIKVDASFVKADEPAPTEPAPTEPAPGSAGFVDVPDDAWFADAVKWAVDKGITNGTSDTTFSPNADLSRGQAVTFLWRLMGEPTPTGTNPFEDVTVNDYFFNAVVWAVDLGVTKGTSDVTFSPSDTVTRGQLVTFIYRLLEEPAVGQDNPFSDVDADAYYSNAVIWAAQMGIVQGYPDGTFKPANNITRAEMVTVLNKGASLAGIA